MPFDPQVLASLGIQVPERSDEEEELEQSQGMQFDPQVLSSLGLRDPQQQQQQQAPMQFDPDVVATVESAKEAQKIRRTYLVDKYIGGLTAPLAPTRREASERALKEVTDPEEREFLISKVAEYARAKAWGREKEYAESGYPGRLYMRGGQVTGQFVGQGGGGMVNTAEDYLDFIQLQGKTIEEVQFKRKLARAQASEDPALGKDPDLALRGAAGAMGMTPDLSAGLLAHRAGGRWGMFTYWTMRLFPERMEDYREMGFSPSRAAFAGAVSSAAEAAIELLNIGPPGLKSIGRKKIGGGLAHRTIVKAIDKVGGKRLGEFVKKYPSIRAMMSGAVDALTRIGLEDVEEGAQAGVRETGKALMALTDEKIEGPTFSSIPPAAWQEMKDTAPALFALMGGPGTGQVVGAGITARAQSKQTKTNEEIVRYAESDMTPSRRTRQKWGLPEEGWKTRQQRKEGTQQLAEEIKAEARIEERARLAVETPAEAPQSAADGLVEPGAVEALDMAEAAEAAPGAVEEAAAVPVPEWTGPISPEASARIEAQRATEEGIEPPPGFLAEEAGAKPIGERFTKHKRPDVIAGGKLLDVSTGDKEVDRRLRESHDIKPVGLKKRVGGALKTAWYYTTRAHVHLPTSDEYATARETFRLLKAVPARAVDEAIRTVASVLHPLGQQQTELFESAIVAQNQARTIKRNAELPPEQQQSLRHGFTSETAAAWHDKIFTQVEATPEVKAALELRGKVVRELVSTLVEEKMLPESTLADPEEYFHQQVNMIQEAKRQSGRLAGIRKKKRGFQKGRTVGADLSAEEFDYGTNYVMSESEWFADSFAELAKADLLETLLGRYDVTEKFKAEAKEAGVTLEEHVNKTSGFDLWQIRPGSPFYRAFSIPEKIGEALQKGIIEEANLTADEVGQVMAIGGPYKSVVLPQTIVDQLVATEKSTDRHWLSDLHRQAMSAWKGYVLLNPKRIIGYNVRNFTGDIDPVLAADPRILKAVPQAFKELWGYHQGTLALSPKLRMARDHAVTSAGFLSGEISETPELQIFRRLKPAEQRVLMRNPLRLYMEVVRPHVEMRENILRYAAFLTYYDQIESGALAHYGAAKKSTVQTLAKEMGTATAAAHMSRELIGDYGNMTEAGEWLRQNLFMFWAFQEINLKRYPHLVVNALKAGQGRARTGAVLSAVALSRIGAAYAAFWAWNNLIYPMLFGRDDEDELGEYDQANPHILVGPNADGTFKNFRNVGALGDFLEWFGVNEAISMIDEYKAGQVDMPDIGWEMGKAWLEKSVGLLRPDIKAGYEVTTGQSLFPTPLSPRSVERDVAVANVFALGDEWKAFKGLIVGEGNRARPHYWKRWFTGIVDPRHTSLGVMYDARRRFLESKGVTEGGVYPVSEYKQARDAAANEDYAAFDEWKTAFQGRHGDRSVKKFRAFLKRLDPIASRLSNKDEMEFEYEYLTTEQQGKLQGVRDYAADLNSLLTQWWVASEQKKPPNWEKGP